MGLLCQILLQGYFSKQDVQDLKAVIRAKIVSDGCLWVQDELQSLIQLSQCLMSERQEDSAYLNAILNLWCHVYTHK